MITGRISSRQEGNARIWTLTVPEQPEPGALIEWSEPRCGSVPPRHGVRGWVITRYYLFYTQSPEGVEDLSVSYETVQDAAVALLPRSI